MAYTITCRTSHAERLANNIVDLIERNTDNAFGESGGWFRCHECGQPAHVFRESPTQEGDPYSRYILGVIRISTWQATYCPYIFLNASEEDGQADHIDFNYYKDTRSSEGGSLRHGHGPGGSGPVLGEKEMLDLMARLVEAKFLSKTDIVDCMNRVASTPQSL